MSTLDMLILLPLVPIAPIVVTWWLPWERWIPWRKLPKALLGPYLLYGAFAALYFRCGLWFVAAVGLVGAGLSVVALIEEVKDIQSDKANRYRETKRDA